MVSIKKKLIYLMHPDKENVFSGYGLPIEDSHHLVGLLMIDRPYRADDEWLSRVREEFGDFHLAYMTRNRERGIPCQMKVNKESRKFLKEMDHPLSEKIAERLYPLLKYRPNPRFRVHWDDDSRMWLSEFDLEEEPYENQKESIEGEKIYPRTKVIQASDLTADCWSIQFWGRPYCRRCDYLATEECGGYRIRKQILTGKYPKGGLPDLSGNL